MATSQRATLIAALVLLLGYPVVAQDPTPPMPSRKPIVLRIDRTEGRVVISLKPNPAPGKDELWALSQLFISHGADYPVLVLLDSKASFKDLNTSLILDKVGFTNIRKFVVDRHTGYMSELTLGAGIPITHDPPWWSQ